MNLWKEYERHKFLEELMDTIWLSSLEPDEPFTHVLKDRKVMWEHLNGNERLKNPVSPLLKPHVSPRMKIKPLDFGKSTCFFTFCKDKSNKKKSKFLSKYTKKRLFGNFLCPKCKKIYLPLFKKISYHYNDWYNNIQSKTIFWYFCIKRAKIYSYTQESLNHFMWYRRVEPALGFWRIRKFFFFLTKKIISLFLKDDHWNKHKRDLCDKRSMRHFSILLYYIYMRIDHLVFYNFNNNYKFNIVV